MNIEDINKEYGKYLEDINELASEKVMETYKEMIRVFGEYIGAIAEDQWKKGFQHAMRVVPGGATK